MLSSCRLFSAACTLVSLAVIFSSTCVHSADIHAQKYWAVELAPNADADELAQRDGFINLGRVGALANTWLFQSIESAEHIVVRKSSAASAIASLRPPRSAETIRSALVARNTYSWFEVQTPKRRYLRQLSFNDPQWDKQWYLNKGKSAGTLVLGSLDFKTLWDAGLRGEGIKVALLDDGIEGDHPDIKHRFVADKSYDYLSLTKDIKPKKLLDGHGTRCAGEIVAEHNNSVCSVGVAPDVRISGIKIIGDKAPRDVDEARALTHELAWNDIYSCSWGPQDDGRVLDGPGRLAQEALRAGIRAGRGGKGAIYVYAAGNGGAASDDCNFDGYANSRYTIAVGGLDALENIASYSERCSAHLVMSFGGSVLQGIATTDFGSKCDSRHQGTSAAAPLVTGAIALMLQARPDLTWRDVQHLLVGSTVINQPDDTEWRRNRAGRLVSHKFAFGLLEPVRLIANARSWVTVPVPQQSFVAAPKTLKGVSGPSAALFRGGTTTSSLHVSRSAAGELERLEHVIVTVSVRHPHRGALRITLRRGDGPGADESYSVLAHPRIHDDSSDGFTNWRFSSVRHWDETPAGNWTLEVTDIRGQEAPEDASKRIGELVDWSIEFLGRCSSATAVRDPGSGVYYCAKDAERNMAEAAAAASAAAAAAAATTTGAAAAAAGDGSAGKTSSSLTSIATTFVAAARLAVLGNRVYVVSVLAIGVAVLLVLLGVFVRSLWRSLARAAQYDSLPTADGASSGGGGGGSGSGSGAALKKRVGSEDSSILSTARMNAGEARAITAAVLGDNTSSGSESSTVRAAPPTAATATTAAPAGAGAAPSSAVQRRAPAPGQGYALAASPSSVGIQGSGALHGTVVFLAEHAAQPTGQ